MRHSVTRAVAALGIAAAATTTVALAAAAPANASGIKAHAAVQLTPSIPKKTLASGTVFVTVGKNSPDAATKNFTFAAYIDGHPVAINARTGGQITATCGATWTITETHVNDADYFVSGGSRSAAVSYSGVAPLDPGYCNLGPSAPDITRDVATGRSVNINVLARATDPDGPASTITITGATSAQYGSISNVVLPTGQAGLRYTSDKGTPVGTTDFFTVQITDQTGLSSEVTVTLNITA